MCSFFLFMVGGALLNGDHDIWIDFSPQNSKVKRLVGRVSIYTPPSPPLVNGDHDNWIDFSHQNSKVKRLGGRVSIYTPPPPLVNGDHDIWIDFSLQTSKVKRLAGRVSIYTPPSPPKPLRRVGDVFVFPSIIGGTPPGKQGLRSLHGTPPSNLK